MEQQKATPLTRRHTPSVTVTQSHLEHRQTVPLPPQDKNDDWKGLHRGSDNALRVCHLQNFSIFRGKILLGPAFVGLA